MGTWLCLRLNHHKCLINVCSKGKTLKNAAAKKVMGNNLHGKAFSKWVTFIEFWRDLVMMLEAKYTHTQGNMCFSHFEVELSRTHATMSMMQCTLHM